MLYRTSWVDSGALVWTDSAWPLFYSFIGANKWKDSRSGSVSRVASPFPRSPTWSNHPLKYRRNPPLRPRSRYPPSPTHVKVSRLHHDPNNPTSRVAIQITDLSLRVRPMPNMPAQQPRRLCHTLHTRRLALKYCSMRGWGSILSNCRPTTLEKPNMF